MEKTDVVIIGAGIAGIASAYYLQKSFPNLSYRIIESRNSVGGTWDQMRFPGVRADNDMYTYGFSFDPWNGSIIGNGKEIKNYLSQVTQKFNIKKHILFNTDVLGSRPIRAVPISWIPFPIGAFESLIVTSLQPAFSSISAA